MKPGRRPRSKNYRKREGQILFLVLGGLLLLVVLRVAVSRHRSQADVEEGLRIIQAEEALDVKTIEERIQAQEEKELGKSQEETDTRSIKEKFATSVIMGDSIAQGFSGYNILNANSVVAETGACLTEAETQIKKVKELSPQVLFVSYGINDIVATDGDVDLFLEEYREVLADVRSALPEVNIFVNSILPVRYSVREENGLYAKVDNYNEALLDMCRELQIGFVDNDSLVKSDDYEKDGIHFQREFYDDWANNMAEVASL